MRFILPLCLLFLAACNSGTQPNTKQECEAACTQKFANDLQACTRYPLQPCTADMGYEQCVNNCPKSN
jgi:hypothetical protein